MHVWSIGRPSPEEQGRHYLWRFWQRLPPPGQIAIFDRTWYGRVLVERVEGLARPKEWRRAYDEINDFEKMLVDDGIRLVKLFLHVSDAEQLRRFRERIETPTKHWKINAEDIRNRAHRRAYLAALDDMFAQTSTAAAPWHVVPAEYKWFARLAVAKTIVKALGKGITLGPPPLAPKSSKRPQKSWIAKRSPHSAWRSPRKEKTKSLEALWSRSSGMAHSGPSPRVTDHQPAHDRARRQRAARQEPSSFRAHNPKPWFCGPLEVCIQRCHCIRYILRATGRDYNGDPDDSQSRCGS